MDYYIIASGYNCHTFVRQCYESLIKLEGNYNWKAILIDDGSTDSTAEELLFLPHDPRIDIRIGKINKGAAKRRFETITFNLNISEETVICLLGLDDALKPNALREVDRKYLSGAWMTYGNWITPRHEMLPKGFLNFDEETHRERNYRKVKYRSTALNTFKKFLFDQFTESDFYFNDTWIKATTESNLMLSCLEMCGKERIGVIETPIYLYNKGRKDNARSRFGSTYQDAIYNDVMNKPKRKLLVR